MHYIYNASFFKADLKEFAKLYLEALPADVTCLLSRGSSGCSICSAMIALSDNRELHHIYIKKDGENSHSLFSGSLNDGEVIAIVDDFTDTGGTVNSLRAWLRDRGVEAKYIILHHGSPFPGSELVILVEGRY